MLNFDFASISAAFGPNAPSPVAPVADPMEKLAELFAGKEADVNAFLLARQQIRAGQTWRDVPAEYAERVLGKPADFMSTVAALVANGGAK